MKLEVSDDNINVNGNKISNSSSTNTATSSTTIINNNRKTAATNLNSGQPPQKKLKSNNAGIRKQKCALDKAISGVIKPEKISDGKDNNNNNNNRNHQCEKGIEQIDSLKEEEG